MTDATIKELRGNEADIIFAAKLAGTCIMALYGQKNKFRIKKDGSPLTLADQASHEAIMKSLSKYSFPIVSEEAPEPKSGWELLLAG